jgi:hypothetical protein
VAVTQLAIAGLPTRDSEHLSQHFTSPQLAERLVEWAITGHRAQRRQGSYGAWRALEPSAGGGAFVDAMVGRFGRVTAHELDPEWCAQLRQRHPAVDLRQGDYLQTEPPAAPYDFCAINPPYEGGQDSQHVEKAMRESIRVLALVRLNFLAGADRFERVWKQIGTPSDPGAWSLDGLVIFVNRPRFSGATGSPKHDFCAVYLTRDPHEQWGACTPDWWHA